MKKLIIPMTIVSCIAISIVYFIASQTHDHYLSPVNNEKQVVSVIEEREKVLRLIDSHTNSEIEFYHIEHQTEEDNNHQDDHEHESFVIEPIKIFIAGLSKNDVNLFSSAFSPKTLSDDLQIREESNKVKLLTDYMRLFNISELNDVQYTVPDRTFGNGKDNKVNVSMAYTNGETKNFQVSVGPVSDMHVDDHDIAYAITTSIWEIGDSIQ